MTARAFLPRIEGAVRNFAMLMSLAAEIAFFRRSVARAVKDLELEQMVADEGGLTDERNAFLDFTFALGLPFLIGAHCKLTGKRPSHDEYKAAVLLVAEHGADVRDALEHRAGRLVRVGHQGAGEDGERQGEDDHRGGREAVRA